MRHLNIPLPELENQSFDHEILDSLQNHPLELKLIQIIKENNCHPSSHQILPPIS